jgi:hypothetical protein
MRRKGGVKTHQMRSSPRPQPKRRVQPIGEVHFGFKNQASEQSDFSGKDQLAKQIDGRRGIPVNRVASGLAQWIAPILQIWVVRSSWDRWQPVGISGIDVSGDKGPPIHCS